MTNMRGSDMVYLSLSYDRFLGSSGVSGIAWQGLTRRGVGVARLACVVEKDAVEHAHQLFDKMSQDGKLTGSKKR
jgi:hypothetical protein